MKVYSKLIAVILGSVFTYFGREISPEGIQQFVEIGGALLTWAAVYWFKNEEPA